MRRALPQLTARGIVTQRAAAAWITSSLRVEGWHLPRTPSFLLAALWISERWAEWWLGPSYASHIVRCGLQPLPFSSPPVSILGCCLPDRTWTMYYSHRNCTRQAGLHVNWKSDFHFAFPCGFSVRWQVRCGWWRQVCQLHGIRCWALASLHDLASFSSICCLGTVFSKTTGLALIRCCVLLFFSLNSCWCGLATWRQTWYWPKDLNSLPAFFRDK